MLTPEDLREVHEALSNGPKTTAQLAIDCKWSLPDAFANLTELEGEGLVEKTSPASRALNQNTIKWRAVDLDELAAEAERRTVDADDEEDVEDEEDDAENQAEKTPGAARSEARASATIRRPLPPRPERGRPETKRGVLWGLGAHVALLALIKALSP